MGALEICILVGAIALVLFTVIFNIVRKKKGKTCCGDCAGCSCCPNKGCKSKKHGQDNAKDNSDVSINDNKNA